MPLTSPLEDLAWAAGLFEGEGCFTVSRKPPRRGKVYVQQVATLTMIDRDVVERFHRIIGFGSFYELPAPRSGTQSCYRWAVQDRAGFARFVHLIEPWLGERRRRRALEVLATPKGDNSAIHQP